jgi:purine-binding chemotaxis protein CheW
MTPIPCCPPHVIGLMNLRGDLITLLDVAPALGAPPVRARADSKVVVLNRLEWGIGVLVDEVLDVLTLEASAVLPSVGASLPSGQEYLQGVTPYRTQMLRLLDLPALLMQQNLIVNESP